MNAKSHNQRPHRKEPSCSQYKQGVPSEELASGFDKAETKFDSLNANVEVGGDLPSGYPLTFRGVLSIVHEDGRHVVRFVLTGNDCRGRINSATE